MVKDTKFESKSQHFNIIFTIIVIAFIGQRYKIWKQITTIKVDRNGVKELLLLVKDTKFESKSQHFLGNIGGSVDCFYWSKIQNLKANHNHHEFASYIIFIAFIGQRYKIWKQITTQIIFLPIPNVLLLLVKDTKFESKSQH